MDLNHPEVKFLAMRVYAQDLVLRAICKQIPQVAAMAQLFIGGYESISLFGDTSDEHRAAIIEHAKRIIGEPPGA